MRRGMVAACAALLLLASAGRADVVKFSRGDELRGTLQEVTFLANGIKSVFPRAEIAGLTLGEKGDDTLELLDDLKAKGNVVSLSFETVSGTQAVDRSKVASITLDSATSAEALKAKQELESETKEEQEKLTPEQKEALTKNKELYDTYAAKCTELREQEDKALEAEYKGQVTKVVADAQRLDRQIQSKRRRRETASRSTSTQRINTSNTTSESEYQRLLRTDGLERDIEDLGKVQQEGIKLKKTIRSEQRKLAEKAKTRESRVLAAGRGNKKKILDGEILSEADMTERYEAAIGADESKTGKETKGKAKGKAKG